LIYLGHDFTRESSVASRVPKDDYFTMDQARIRASIDAFVAAWNEHDASKRTRLIEEACTEDVVLITGARRIEGRVQIDAFIANFQQRRPHDRAVFTSPIDIQGSIFRYTGKVEGQAGGDAMDVGECDGTGKIRLLLTFVGATLASSIAP